MEPIFQVIFLLTLILPHIYLFLNKPIKNEQQDNIFKCALQKYAWFYDILVGTVNTFTLLNSKCLRFFHFLKHTVLFPCYHRTICSSLWCLFICCACFESSASSTLPISPSSFTAVVLCFTEGFQCFSKVCCNDKKKMQQPHSKVWAFNFWSHNNHHTRSSLETGGGEKGRSGCY